MRIDPARLSRLLLSLTQRPERADGQSTAASKTAATKPKAIQKKRDPAQLRARLRNRLGEMKRQPAQFAESAPVVTIQEILCWEFGQEILEHPDFHRIANAVTDSLLEDQRLALSMQQLIAELAT